ncbi:MAG TPA: formate--tetrahydrofolate ligase [Flavobacteriaceae bacterium]|nr:formate--tetrahydrofolate ligase [Flavobacteriaceae bacterium]
MIETTFPTDIEIAQQADIRPISDIAASLGIPEKIIEPYGHYKAKLPLDLINPEAIKKSNLILVTSINPTPAGEGKTTVSIGLVDALKRIGEKSIAVLREPSLGPVFGIKGGAAGGGYSQAIPMEDINLHFTGDFHAIEAANNLLAAAIDNNLQHKKRSLNIDPRNIRWKRTMDMNDRSLRQILVGLGGKANGIPRETGFDITAASEIMAILCLAENFTDLKKRLGEIYIGDNMDGEPVFARDLKVTGAMAILLKDAIKPNLVQTLEGTPVLLHGGPFASIAQGTNSVVATKTGMSLADYVVTEAGFGADLGAEKFFNIKCRSAELEPAVGVIVVTVRALRHHGGANKDAYNTPDLEKVKAGFENVAKHIENMKRFGVSPIVAINSFSSDSYEETEFIIEACNAMGIEAVRANGFTEGGAGSEMLAHAVIRTIDNKQSTFKLLYDLEQSIEDKIKAVATEIYGAAEVNYTAKAKRQLRDLKRKGFEDLAICMVKTPNSLTDNAKIFARPKDFTINVREFEIAAGAGFILPILGNTLRMPGLPSIPAAENMDIDDQGVIKGLS